LFWDRVVHYFVEFLQICVFQINHKICRFAVGGLALRNLPICNCGMSPRTYVRWVSVPWLNQTNQLNMQSCPFCVFTRELTVGVYTLAQADANLNKHMLYQRPWWWSYKKPPPTTRQRRLTVVAAAWERKGTFCASVPLIFSLNNVVKVRKLVYVIAKEITKFFSIFFWFTYI
jgi:hypothetical protein